MYGKRRKMQRRASRKYFSRAADRIHPKNSFSVGAIGGPMRGGIRL